MAIGKIAGCMKGCVYILKMSNNRYYIGSTNNLDRRLQEHRMGKTAYLKNLLPIKLVFCQEFNDIATARKIELKLKRGKNRKILERIIEDKKITMGL